MLLYDGSDRVLVAYFDSELGEVVFFFFFFFFYAVEYW